MTNEERKAIRARVDAATAAIAGGDQPAMRLEDRVGTMVFAFAPGDGRIAAVRDLAHRVRDIEHSSMDVPALLDENDRLRAALAEVKCRLCDGSGKTQGTCSDPHCGESLWEHHCGEDKQVPCAECGGTGVDAAARAALNGGTP